MQIESDDPTRADVVALLGEHVTEMFSVSPAESVHALDPSALNVPSISFFTAREDGVLLGCGAVRDLDGIQAELKSMRTADFARGRGVASALLLHMACESHRRGFTSLSLETGTEPFFAPARALYLKYGFTECAPFGEYLPDPHSVFYTLDLAARPKGATAASGCIASMLRGGRSAPIGWPLGLTTGCCAPGEE